MTRLRVGVLASGQGTNLQALLDTVHGHEADVVAVGSDQPQARALVRARDAGVPARVFAVLDHPDRALRDAAMADWLEAQRVELVVLAGYMALLDAGFIARFRDRIINVHPSLLPAFPGVRAIEQALAHGVKVVGVTVHFVDEGVDTGPIILQRSVELGDALDPGAVLERLRPLEHELLPRAVRLLAAGAIRRDPAHPRRVVVDDG
jgi:phosphoribosylglycinamide formyltransferase-1